MDKALIGLAMVWFMGILLSFQMEGAQGAVTTTLSTNVGETATTFTVVSTAGFPSAGILTIREELASYTGTTATSFTGITRGVDNTQPNSHDSGDIVYSEAAGAINNLLDFSSLDFSGNIFQQVGTLAVAAGRLFTFLFRVLIWDFSYFDQTVMGVPMVYLQYFFYAISFGVLVRFFIVLRGV